MTSPLKLLPWMTKQLRRHAGAPGAPSTLLSGQIFGNEVDLNGLTLWWGGGDDGSGNSTSQIAFGGPGYVRPPPANVADANYQMLVTDGGVHITTLTASRVITLPALAAARTARMRPFSILDESGNASSARTITIQPATGDSINGIAAGQPGGAVVLMTPFQPVMLRPGYTTWIFG